MRGLVSRGDFGPASRVVGAERIVVGNVPVTGWASPLVDRAEIRPDPEDGADASGPGESVTLADGAISVEVDPDSSSPPDERVCVTIALPDRANASGRLVDRSASGAASRFATACGGSRTWGSISVDGDGSRGQASEIA